ncbi:hypothetical protein T439DRAFT_319262 [Meredithblackwellia eburnea MCA 4105]
MWCNNCKPVFLPLRGGAIFLSSFLALYSMAGGIFLFLKGQFLYFTYPEPQLYGGVAVGVAVLAALGCIAYSNRSYMWTRVLFYLGPFVLFLCAVRAGLMIFRLNYYQANVIWECNHGGQLYNSTLAGNSSYSGAGDSSNGTIPTGFCSSGFHSLYLAFAFALAIDLIVQIYAWFLTWRYKAFLEQQAYSSMKGPMGPGIYA